MDALDALDATLDAAGRRVLDTLDAALDPAFDALDAAERRLTGSLPSGLRGLGECLRGLCAPAAGPVAPPAAPAPAEMVVSALAAGAEDNAVSEIVSAPAAGAEDSAVHTPPIVTSAYSVAKGDLVPVAASSAAEGDPLSAAGAKADDVASPLPRAATARSHSDLFQVSDADAATDAVTMSSPMLTDDVVTEAHGPMEEQNVLAPCLASVPNCSAAYRYDETAPPPDMGGVRLEFPSAMTGASVMLVPLQSRRFILAPRTPALSRWGGQLLPKSAVPD